MLRCFLCFFFGGESSTSESAESSSGDRFLELSSSGVSAVVPFVPLAVGASTVGMGSVGSDSGAAPFWSLLNLSKRWRMRVVTASCV